MIKEYDMKKRSLLLIWVTLYAITSCGKPESEAGISGIFPPAPDGLSAGYNESNGFFSRYDKEITLSTVLGYLTSAEPYLTDGRTADNNIYTDLYKEKLNIKLDYQWTMPFSSDSEYTEKISLQVASGDLPDILRVNPKIYSMLLDADMLIDLTDIIDEYAYPAMKQNMSGTFSSEMAVNPKDGRVYGVPVLISYLEIADAIWLRKDWLVNLNLPIPTTYNELKEVAIAFTNNDPDQNGKNDTYGFAANAQGVGNLFFNIFHAYNLWVEENGKLVHGLFGNNKYQDRTRTALVEMHELYNVGAIDKEFTSLDDWGRDEALITGKCGIYLGSIWGPWWPLYDTLVQNQEAEWICLPLVSFDNAPAKVQSPGTTAFEFNVVTKGCKYPEALIKMLNWYHRLNNDPNTAELDLVNVDPVSNAEIYLLSPVHFYDPVYNYSIYKRISEALKTGNPALMYERTDKLTYTRAMAYLNDGDREQWPYFSDYYGEDCGLAIADYYNTNDLYIFNGYKAIPSETINSLEPAIGKMWNQTLVDVVTTGNLNLYDYFLTEYFRIGGMEIDNEVNKWFDNKK
jgi:putative aldouronate transport system substrate-binding protein